MAPSLSSAGTFAESQVSPSVTIWLVSLGHTPVAAVPCMSWQMSGATKLKAGSGFGHADGVPAATGASARSVVGQAFEVLAGTRCSSQRSSTAWTPRTS